MSARTVDMLPKGRTATTAFWQPCPVSWTVLEVCEDQASGRDLVAERFAAGEQVRRRRIRLLDEKAGR